MRCWKGAGQSGADAHQSYRWTGNSRAAVRMSLSGAALLMSPAALSSRIRGSKMGVNTGGGRPFAMARCVAAQSRTNCRKACASPRTCWRRAAMAMPPQAKVVILTIAAGNPPVSRPSCNAILRSWPEKSANGTSDAFHTLPRCSALGMRLARGASQWAMTVSTPGSVGVP